MDFLSVALAGSNSGLGHGSRSQGASLAEINNLPVCRDLNLIVHDFFFKISRNDLQASVVQLFVVAQEISAVLHEMSDPIVEVLVQVVKLRAPRPAVQRAPRGVLHD